MLSLPDFILFSIAAYFLIAGFYHGAIKTILSDISFAAAIFLTILLFDSTSNILTPYLKQPLLLALSALSLSYFVSTISCSFLIKQIKFLVKPISGSFIDKLCGLAMGTINGALSTALLFCTAAILLSMPQEVFQQKTDLKNMVLLVVREQEPYWLHESKSAHIIKSAMKAGLAVPQISKSLEEAKVDIHHYLTKYYYKDEKQEEAEDEQKT